MNWEFHTYSMVMQMTDAEFVHIQRTQDAKAFRACHYRNGHVNKFGDVFLDVVREFVSKDFDEVLAMAESWASLEVEV